VPPVVFPVADGPSRGASVGTGTSLAGTRDRSRSEHHRGAVAPRASSINQKVKCASRTPSAATSWAPHITTAVEPRKPCQPGAGPSKSRRSEALSLVWSWSTLPLAHKLTSRAKNSISES
jgi:hypothetical protein